MRYLPHSVITIDHRDDQALFKQLLSRHEVPPSRGFPPRYLTQATILSRVAYDGPGLPAGQAGKTDGEGELWPTRSGRIGGGSRAGISRIAGEDR